MLRAGGAMASARRRPRQRPYRLTYRTLTGPTSRQHRAFQ